MRKRKQEIRIQDGDSRTLSATLKERLESAVSTLAFKRAHTDQNNRALGAMIRLQGAKEWQ